MLAKHALRQQVSFENPLILVLKSAYELVN